MTQSEIQNTANIAAGNTSPASSVSASYRFVKRAFDIVFSLLLSIISFIPVLFIATLIVLKDHGSPFYMQKRVGRQGKPIGVLKFRTMRKGAEDYKNALSPELLKEYLKEYKLRDDPRLIGWKKPGDGQKCFGAVLRKCSIDEIMQIPYNILLKGNMSFVGPRPVLEDELLANYTPDEREQLLSVKPGLTGYWQAYARNTAGYEDGKRQQMELYYAGHRSIKLDVKLLFKTVAVVISGEGAR